MEAGRRFHYAIALIYCLFVGFVSGANAQFAELPSSLPLSNFSASLNTTESELFRDHDERKIVEPQSFIATNLLFENATSASFAKRNSTTDLLILFNENITSVTSLEEMKTASLLSNTSLMETSTEYENSTDNFTIGSTIMTADLTSIIIIEEKNNTETFTFTSISISTPGTFMQKTDTVSADAFENVSSINPVIERKINLTTTLSPFAIDDARLNRALLATLIAVAILCIASLCFLFAWRRWRGQLSGEWVLNKNARQYSRAGTGGFENECYNSNYKLSRVSCNLDDSSVQFARPIYNASKIGNSSISVNQTRLYDSRDQLEMIEMVQKTSSSSNEGADL